MPHITINNLTSKIEDIPYARALETLLREELSYEVPGAFFSPAYRNHGWNGRKYLYKDGYFPTGLLGRVFRFLDKERLPVTFEDCRELPTRGKPLPLKAVLDEYSQRKPLELALQQERGILRLPTGGGKTYLLAALAAELNVKMLVTTHKLDILEQIVDTLSELLPIPIGIVQGKTKDIQQVTVGMLPSLTSCLENQDHDPEAARVAEFVESAEALVTDEAHHLGSDSYFKLANRCFNAYWRYGLTATPFRTDNGTLLIEACTSGKIVDITASDLIERKRLAKPYIWFVQWDAGEAKQKAAITHSNIALKGTQRYQKIREEAIVGHPTRNNLIASLAAERVRKNRTVLIVVTTLRHSQLLYDLIAAKIGPDRVRVADGSLPKEERKIYLQQLNKKELMCIIATSVFGEGVNVPALHCLINATGRDSTVDTFQIVGRALRRTPTKSRTIVLDFWDDIRYFKKSALHRWQALEQEPQFQLRKISATQLRLSRPAALPKNPV